MESVVVQIRIKRDQIRIERVLGSQGKRARLIVIVSYCTRRDRSLKVAVQGPDFWPTPSTYIHTYCTRRC
jgi:hypothetical protein